MKGARLNCSEVVQFVAQRDSDSADLVEFPSLRPDFLLPDEKSLWNRSSGPFVGFRVPALFG